MRQQTIAKLHQTTYPTVMSDDQDGHDASATTPAGSKPYVLIAEDAPFYAAIDKREFEKSGFEVAVVGDGQQLLDAARKRKPDILLLDAVMPVKDGSTTLAELKADPDLKQIPALIFSNLAQPEEIEKFRQLGAADFISKTSASHQQIVEKVMTYLKS
jgi:CheY-like chemotaxis protein